MAEGSAVNIQRWEKKTQKKTNPLVWAVCDVGRIKVELTQMYIQV